MRFQRGNDPLTVMMIDQDDLEAINDGYGHALGDKILTTVPLIFLDGAPCFGICLRIMQCGAVRRFGTIGGNMFSNHDLGASLYKTWSKKERRDEVARLVEGYRNGLPVGILCKMSETVAGSRKSARALLREMLTSEERTAAVARETGGMRIIAEEFLL